MEFFKVNVLAVAFMAALLPVPVCADLYMRGGGSTLTVGAGAVLALDNPLQGFEGTLVQSGPSSIQGKSISFKQGTFESDGRSLLFNGSLTPSNTSNLVQLTGNQKIVGNGLLIPSSLAVRGRNNRIEGTLFFAGPICLQDTQTTLTCALYRPLAQDILLNGGSMRLENDLMFADGYAIQGPGEINVNNRRLSFGAQALEVESPLIFKNACDITLSNNIILEEPWTFRGKNLINGNGNWIAFEDDGEIVVDHDATLIVNNVNFAHLGDYKIRCVDNTSSLVLMNVSLNMTSNYGFTVGSLLIDGNCVIKSGGRDVTFAYQSAMTTTLDMASSLWIDYGVTFSFDSGKDNFYSTVCGSQFILNGSTLHVTKGGLNLQKCTLIIGEDARVFVEDGEPDPETGSLTNQGLTLGADDARLDSAVRFLPGATCEVLHGKLCYKNINSYSWRMPTVDSMMQFDAGAVLQLDQSLNLGRGCLKMSSQAGLTQNNGARVTGFVDCF